MNLIVLFILGAVIAFVVSIPIGAVNMAIFQTTIFHNKKAGYSIGLGAVIAELFYCGIPLFSLTVFLVDSGVIDFLFLAFIPLLLFLGVYNIVQRKKGISEEEGKVIPTKRKSYLSYIVYGFFLCLSNPMTLFFWIQATLILRAQKLLSTDLIDTLAFTLGVPVGTFLLYGVFVVLADRTRSRLNPKLHARINVVIGLIFIILSIYLFYRYMTMDKV